MKLKDNNYIDSTGITHNRELLSDILDNNMILEKVTNTHGTYIKYKNGKLIQYGIKVFSSQAFNVSYGGVYITSSALTIQFPLYFIDQTYIDSLVFTPIGFGGGVGGLSGAGYTYAAFSVYPWHAKVYTLPVTISWFAIGRWK